MGITTALNTSVGSYPLKYFKMYKLLVAAAVAVCVSAEADPGVLVAAPALYNAYPNWPGVSTPYSQSTCYGCRPYVYGKRSADAEPEADAFYAPYAYAHMLMDTHTLMDTYQSSVVLLLTQLVPPSPRDPHRVLAKDQLSLSLLMPHMPHLSQ